MFFLFASLSIGALPIGLPEELEARVAVVADLPRSGVGAAAHVHVPIDWGDGFDRGDC